MKYCKNCLEPDTRPGSVFDETGICFPCQFMETAKNIDWSAQKKKLDEIAVKACSRNTSGYDCIIPVSGGKDSHRQALYMKEIVGLKPLLVSCHYPPQQQTERGARNMGNLIQHEFDAVLVSPSPKTWVKLMKIGFIKFGNFYKPTELAIYASVPKFATMYDIPLLVYGENPATSWGGDCKQFDQGANALRHANTLQGGDLSPYLDAGFNLRDLYWHRFPEETLVSRMGIRCIWLGDYVPEWNDQVTGELALRRGLEPRTGKDAILEDIGQLTTYDALDCDFVQINQMLKYFKLGFGKASEQASGLIRAGLMTREEAIEKIKDVDGQCADRYIHKFCDFIDITEQEFWEVANSFRNPEIWEKSGAGWRHKYPLD